ncbi:MAG: hypothetical protein ABIE94_03685 [archaeon]
MSKSKIKKLDLGSDIDSFLDSYIKDSKKPGSVALFVIIMFIVGFGAGFFILSGGATPQNDIVGLAYTGVNNGSVNDTMPSPSLPPRTPSKSGIVYVQQINLTPPAIELVFSGLKQYDRILLKVMYPDLTTENFTIWIEEIIEYEYMNLSINSGRHIQFYPTWKKEFDLNLDNQADIFMRLNSLPSGIKANMSLGSIIAGKERGEIIEFVTDWSKKAPVRQQPEPEPPQEPEEPETPAEPEEPAEPDPQPSEHTKPSFTLFGNLKDYKNVLIILGGLVIAAIIVLLILHMHKAARPSGSVFAEKKPEPTLQRPKESKPEQKIEKKKPEPEKPKTQSMADRGVIDIDRLKEKEVKKNLADPKKEMLIKPPSDPAATPGKKISDSLWTTTSTLTETVKKIAKGKKPKKTNDSKRVKPSKRKK